MRFSLSSCKWRLKGTERYVPIQGDTMETGRAMKGLTPWIDCQVPGGVALALYRAGWIEHPYFGMNSLKAEWIEHRWWMYETTFRKPMLEGTRFSLVFHGVDYDALIYLNNQFLGEHVGMYDAFSFDITDTFLEAETLKLVVILKDAPDEMGQVGYTSETQTQKSRFNYKWDFGTRLVNLGIWKDVEIIAEEACALRDLHVRTDVTDEGAGQVIASGAVEGRGEDLEVRLEVRLDQELCAAARLPVENGRFCGMAEIPWPELWWPNGAGAQPLYDVRLVLHSADRRLDTADFRQGIRRLRFVPNENSPADALPYTYEINGKWIYIKGVNMTPLDHIYGDIPEERYAATLRAAAAMNVNMIRVWGGGIFEKECFYNLCDELGILVWQEFIQSSSGIDNIPSVKPEFLRLLEKSSRYAASTLRNYTSLAAWSGGNELMKNKSDPVGYDHPNIALLKRIVEETNPEHFFYPTSASGPSFRQADTPGISHDVHGEWEYAGNPKHYEKYGNADHLFNSEFGSSGVSGTRTAMRVLPEKSWVPVSVAENADWRFRGDWWCSFDRDTQIFGQLKDLPEFVSASQWIQAESIRFMVEANRRRAFHSSGSLIWQFNEPWPNITCTCLYTYYDEAKMGYFWAKDAFKPFHVSLDYRTLNPMGEFVGSLWLSRDDCAAGETAVLHWEALAMDGRVLFCGTGEMALPGVHSTRCMDLRFPVPHETVYALRVSARCGEQRDSSIYFFSTEETNIYRPYLRLPAPELKTEKIEESPGVETWRVTNQGASAALHIHCLERSDQWLTLPEEDFFTLFPGESRTVSVSFRERFRYGFDEYADVRAEGEPDVVFIPFPLKQMLP